MIETSILSPELPGISTPVIHLGAGEKLTCSEANRFAVSSSNSNRLYFMRLQFDSRLVLAGFLSIPLPPVEIPRLDLRREPYSGEGCCQIDIAMILVLAKV